MDLIPLGVEELKDADGHRVVLELRFVDDFLLRRQQDVSVLDDPAPQAFRAARLPRSATQDGQASSGGQANVAGAGSSESRASGLLGLLSHGSVWGLVTSPS